MVSNSEFSRHPLVGRLGQHPLLDLVHRDREVQRLILVLVGVLGGELELVAGPTPQ